MVSRLHYTALHSLVQGHQLPILQHYHQQKQQQQQQQQQAKSKRGGFANSRDRYPSTETPPQPQGGHHHGSMSVQSTQGVYTPQGSAEHGFPGYGFTPAPSLF